ncbi:uncharacterized protein METZ01_LOCUS328793, partial [marine metagenome]
PDVRHRFRQPFVCRRKPHRRPRRFGQLHHQARRETLRLARSRCKI